MYESLGASAVFSMPYLYVQRRHLDETHALLAATLGDDAQHTTVEDTRCFVVRPAASHVPNLRDAPPPLGGLVVRRRADADAPPPPAPGCGRPRARRRRWRGCRGGAAADPAELGAVYPRLPAAAADAAEAVPPVWRLPAGARRAAVGGDGAGGAPADARNAAALAKMGETGPAAG